MSNCILLSSDKIREYADRILNNQGVEISPDYIYGIVAVLYNNGEIENVNDVDSYADKVADFAITNGLTTSNPPQSAIDTINEAKRILETGASQTRQQIDRKATALSNDYISKIIIKDIEKHRGGNKSVGITKARFEFYIKSGIDVNGISELLDGLRKAGNDDPARVLADLAFDSYAKIQKEYADKIEDIAVEFEKYIGIKRSEYNDSSISGIKNALAKVGIDRAIAWVIFYSKYWARKIYSSIVNLITPGRRFRDAGDELMYAILLGAKDLRSVRRMLRGKSDRTIAKNLNESLVKNNVELEVKIHEFFNNSQVRRDGSFSYSNGITAVDIRNMIDNFIDQNKESRFSGNKVLGDYMGKKISCIADIMVAVGAIKKNDDGSYDIDTNDDEAVSKYAVVVNHLGQKMNMSLYDIAQYSRVNENDTMKIKFNDDISIVPLIKENNLSELKDSIDKARSASNKIISFRRNELAKLNKIIDTAGDKLSPSAKKSIYAAQHRANDINLAGELESFVAIVNSMVSLIDDLRPELNTFASSYAEDKVAKLTMDGISKYMSKLDIIYNSYISVINDMTSDVMEFVKDAGILNATKGGALDIFENVLKNAGIADTSTIKTAIENIANLVNNTTRLDHESGRTVNTMISEFNNIREKVFFDFMDAVGAEHNFSASKIEELKSHAEAFPDDISFINKYIGYYHETRSDELQLAASMLADAVSKGKIAAFKKMVRVDELADAAYREDGVTSADFVELDEYGIPTGYFKTKYKLGAFKKAIDQAHEDIIKKINKKHENEVGYPISSISDIVTDAQKREFADLFTDWKFFGGEPKVDENGKYVFSPQVKINLSLYAGDDDYERLSNAYKRNKLFNQYPDSVFAKLSELRERERAIMIGVDDMSNANDDVREELAQIDFERKQLGSLYYPSGVLKTGSDLKDAIAFNDITRQIKDLRPTKYDEERFKRDYDSSVKKILDKVSASLENDLRNASTNNPDITEDVIKSYKNKLANAIDLFSKEFYSDDTRDTLKIKDDQTLNYYISLVTKDIVKWTRARRFRVQTDDFNKALSRVARTNTREPSFGSFKLALYRAAIGMKRVNLSRIAVGTNGMFASNEIRKLVEKLDYAYDGIKRDSPSGEYITLGADAFNEIVGANDKAMLFNLYNRALRYIQLSTDVTVDTLTDEMVNELRNELVKFQRGVVGVESTLYTSSSLFNPKQSIGDIEFDDVFTNILKPSVQRSVDEIHDKIRIARNVIDSIEAGIKNDIGSRYQLGSNEYNEALRTAINNENTSNPTYKAAKEAIERYNGILAGMHYTVKFGNTFESKLLSSLSVLTSKSRHLKIGEEDYEMFNYGYIGEYIDRSNDVEDITVNGLTPNDDLPEFNNGEEFEKLMSNPATKAFYDAMIATKKSIDEANGVRNTEESAVRIPIKEVDHKELKLRKSISKIGRSLSVNDGNLTDGQYMAIQQKSKALSAKDQTGALIRRRVVPMSRRLENMAQCSVNILNSMHEYANRSMILAEKDKVLGATNTLMGVLKDANTNRAGSASVQNAMSSETDRTPVEENRIKRGISAMFSSSSGKTYENSNIKSAYDDLIDKQIFGIGHFNAFSKKKWIVMSKIFKFMSKFVAKALINWKIVQSTVNSMQVGENVVMKQLSDMNVHNNADHVIAYMAEDVPSKVRDTKSFVKKSKIAYLNSMLGLHDDSRYDRIVKGAGVGAATDVVVSKIDEFYSNGFNMIGDVVISDPAVLSRMFDFKFVPYTVILDDGTTEDRIKLMQEGEYEMLKAKGSDSDGHKISAFHSNFKTAVSMPHAIVRDSDTGLPMIDERYRDAFERDSGRVGAIIRAYSSYIKSSVSSDEEGKLISDPLTQCIFIFRTWCIQKFYQLHGHMFGSPVYNYRDRRVSQGCIWGVISRLFGSKKLENFIRGNFSNDKPIGPNNKSVADLMLSATKREQSSMFLVNILTGFIYQMLNSYVYTLASIDPDCDDRRSIIEKKLHNIIAKLASEHLDTDSLLGMIPSWNKVTFFDVVWNTWTKAAYYKMLELAGSPNAVYSNGEFNNAKKLDVLLISNLLPVSDYLITGNEIKSELHYIYGGGGFQGVLNDAILSLIMGGNDPERMSDVISDLDGYKSYTALGYDTDVRSTDIYKNPELAKVKDMNIILRGFLETRDINYDSNGDYIPRSGYFTNGKLNVKGKAVVSKFLYKTYKQALSGNLPSDDFGEYDYCKAKVDRLLMTLLSESMKPYDSRVPLINMDNLRTEGKIYEEAVAINKLNEMFEDNPSKAVASKNEQDQIVRMVINDLLNNSILDDLGIDRKGDAYKEVLEAIK